MIHGVEITKTRVFSESQRPSYQKTTLVLSIILQKSTYISFINQTCVHSSEFLKNLHLKKWMSILIFSMDAFSSTFTVVEIVCKGWVWVLKLWDFFFFSI